MFSFKNILIAIWLWAWTAGLHAQVEFTGSHLPVVVIETGGQEIVDDPRITAHMGIIWNGDGISNQITDPFNNYDGLVSIEYRGATSQLFPKKSYGFETQDAMGENRNVSLMGLPEENDWVLYAPYSDKSLLRNILSYRLFRDMGHYSPRTRLCELVVNGDYRGVYVLIEKIKRDQDRLDIARLEPDETSGEDLTGGYILKIDKLSGDPGPVWSTQAGGIYFQYEYPEYDDIVQEQKEYLRNYLDQFEEALTSVHFTDTLHGYRKYLDAASAVDMFLINELSRNVDGYFLSTFLYKRADQNGGKLYMGPVWDFNLSFGNPDYRQAYRTDGFQIRQNPAIWWWDRLLEDPRFISDIRTRWSSMREEVLSDGNILGIVDSLTTFLGEAQVRNFTRWPILEYPVWPNYFTGASYGEEVEYLKNWTLERLQWLDQALMTWTGENRMSEESQISLSLFPNPFREILRCSFMLEQPGRVSLSLFNMQGTEVVRIQPEQHFPAGEHLLEWSSSGVPASLYMVVLRIDGRIVSSQRVVKTQ